MTNTISTHTHEPLQKSPNVAHDILLSNNILHRVLQLADNEGVDSLLQLSDVSEDMRNRNRDSHFAFQKKYQQETETVTLRFVAFCKKP